MTEPWADPGGAAGMIDPARSVRDAARARADLAPSAGTGMAAVGPPPVRTAPGRLARMRAALSGWRLLAPVPAGAALTPRRLVRALSHRTRRRAISRLRALPCFHPDEYASMYPDLAAARMDLHVHALFVGGFEERRLFRPEALARSLAAPLPPAEALPPGPGTPPVVLYVSSLGNVFMREIAEDIAANLRAAGAPALVRDETGPPAAAVGAIFVAPHEFFTLGRGTTWVREAVIARALMLNTEQPQTRWFGRALPFLLAGRGIIDLCPQSAALFAASGMPSLHLTPAPAPMLPDLSDADRRHPLFRVLPEAARATPHPHTPFAARPLDLCFFGTESRLREAWLSRHAGTLAELDCVIHYRREDRGPLGAGAPDAALTRLARHVAGHSRIALNLHRDAFGYLEWHRMLRQGIAAGAVVVSEPCLPHPLLAPGTHYFEAPGRQIPGLLEWLLRSADGARAAARAQAQGRALLAEAVTPRAAAARLLGFVHAHARPGAR